MTLKEIFINNKNKWLTTRELESLQNEFYGGSLRFKISELRIRGLTIIHNKKLGYKYTTNFYEYREYAWFEIQKLEQQKQKYINWITDNGGKY